MSFIHPAYPPRDEPWLGTLRELARVPGAKHGSNVLYALLFEGDVVTYADGSYYYDPDVVIDGTHYMRVGKPNDGRWLGFGRQYRAFVGEAS